MSAASDPQEQGYFELRVAHGGDYGGYEREDRWQYLRAEVTPQEDIPDVGDDAFRSSDEVMFFRKGNQVLHTAANSGDDPSTADRVVELARRVARRIYAGLELVRASGAEAHVACVHPLGGRLAGERQKAGQWKRRQTRRWVTPIGVTHMGRGAHDHT